MTDLITVIKLILSGIVDEVDLLGKRTENKEMARKKDKVCKFMR